jgi:hypothetical protein
MPAALAGSCGFRELLRTKYEKNAYGDFTNEHAA